MAYFVPEDRLLTPGDRPITPDTQSLRLLIPLSSSIREVFFDCLAREKPYDLKAEMLKALSECRTPHSPDRWVISVYIMLAASHRSDLLQLEVTPAGASIRLADDTLHYRTVCPSCSGIGYMPRVEGSEVAKHLLREQKGSESVPVQAPAEIISVCTELAETIDRFRGEGLFDRQLKESEAVLKKLKHPLLSFQIWFESLLERKGTAVSVAFITRQVLGGVFISLGKQVSSYWEHNKITGSPSPGFKVVHYAPCTRCKGRGLGD